MSDLIERETAIYEILRLTSYDTVRSLYEAVADEYDAYNHGIMDAIDVIVGLTSPQPERNKGKLLPHKAKFWKKLWKCSECGAVTENASTAHYCYNCGAKMEDTDGN